MDQLAEQAAEFEPGLVAAVVGFRRAEHRRQPLLPPHKLVAHGRHVMLPDAAAQEAEFSRRSPFFAAISANAASAPTSERSPAAA